MPIDLMDLAFIGAGLLALGIAVVVLAWPGADHDDVLARVQHDPYGAPFGDVPHLFTGSGAGVALRPEAGGGGPSRVLSGDAAARAFYRSQALADE